MATSPATEHAARELGLQVEPFDGLDRLDIAIDGADQVAPDGWLVKGGGGAHLREKIVAAAAERFVVIVDSGKPVEELSPPVPLELSSFGLTATLRALGAAELRDAPPSPDGGLIADYLGPVGDPEALAARLAATPGVVEHGLFGPELVSDVLVGRGERVQALEPSATRRVAGVAELGGWRLWWVKRRWYERNRRLVRRWRINRHMARAGAYIRFPVEGEVLEALDEGRLVIGEGTLLEPGCWLTLSPQARIEIGEGCFLNRNVMLAALERIEIGDHVMFANGCFVGDAAHRFDDPDQPITWQGFTSKGPVRIGSNCWFGVNCVVTSGVEIGERCVIGANSVVTQDLPPRVIAAGHPGEGDQGDRVPAPGGEEE